MKTSSAIATSGTKRVVPVVPDTRMSYRPVRVTGSSYRVRPAPPKRSDR
jgi:hypothetical protein